MDTTLADLHVNADTLVAVALDGVEFTLDHAGGVADAFGDLGFAGVGATGTGQIDDAGGDFAQAVVGEGEAGIGHGRGLLAVKGYNLTPFQPAPFR